MLPCWVGTPPGIWRVAADLMCDRGSFFISFFFHGGTRSKVVVRSLAEEGWGAFSKKHEVSNPAMLGHPFGQAASLSAAAESLLCFSRKLGSSGFYISSWWMLNLLLKSRQHLTCLKRDFIRQQSPRFIIRSHYGHGCSRLSLDWELLSGWNFPCTYPLPYCSEWEAGQ